MAAVVVARVAELRPGTGRLARVNGRDYAVWLVGAEEVYVLDNDCQHLGGPLADGLVTDGCVVCPWHGWAYELATGRRRTAFGETSGVGSHRAWVEGDNVWADLP
jgi:nitrite reductase (NADH) small subunit